ncbi:MAG TPA: hypothetical protein VMH28_03350 [Candidatus Acidoferrales bacterium]|nr:hypothetical protein [Candidatus Acidoferrales bacterium]
MPLIAPEPPPQVAETVQSTFRAAVEPRSVKIPALRRAAGPLTLTEPHQIFSLGLNDLAAGRALEGAKPTGWRYLVRDTENVLASAETAIREGGAEHVFSAFNASAAVASTVRALQTARGLPEVRGGSFEQRLLRIPALYFTALWMHSTQGGEDLLVPLEPSPDVPIGQAVPAAQLLGELASKAKSVPALGPDDRTGG